MGDGVKACQGCQNPATVYVRYHYSHGGVLISAGGASVCDVCLAEAEASAAVIVDRVPLVEAVAS